MMSNNSNTNFSFYSLPTNLVWLPFYAEVPYADNPGHLLWDYLLPLYTLLELFWDPNDDKDLQVGKTMHKGRRYCFMAAIQGADPRVEPPNRSDSEKAGLVPGTFWAFCPQKKTDHTGDYHKVFNGSNFVNWWKTQLLPNLHQPSIIYMDNAKYHKTLPSHAPK